MSSSAREGPSRERERERDAKDERTGNSGDVKVDAHTHLHLLHFLLPLYEIDGPPISIYTPLRSERA